MNCLIQMFPSLTVPTNLIKHLCSSHLILFTVMRVLLASINWIVSLNLKHTIVNYYSEAELPDLSRDTVQLEINGKNESHGDLKIVDYEHLETIKIGHYSLQNIRSLIIKDNPNLERIVVDVCACEHVLFLELASSFDLFLFIWSSSVNNIVYRVKVIP